MGYSTQDLYTIAEGCTTTAGPQAECPEWMTETAEGCFTVVETNEYWADAEKKACQGYGSNVHLATPDTQEVTFIRLLSQGYGNYVHLATPDTQEVKFISD